jgi:hypothetical protein
VADIDPAQPSVPQVSPSEPLQVTVRDVHDARGNLVPDAAKIGITAQGSVAIVGNSYVQSAGGTIADGTTAANNSNWRYYTLVSNGFVSTYTTDGSTLSSPGQTATANLSLAMVDPNGNVLDINAISVYSLILVPPSNAVGSAQPASVLSDGGIHTSTVTFTPIIDAYGNTVPDGTNLAVTATGSTAILGNSYIQSAGGQIVSGTPATNNSNFKIHTVQNGTLTVTYADQNVTATPGQELTANVIVTEANSSNQVTNNYALGIAPVILAGLTSAHGVANPTSVFANGGDYRSTITLSNFRDAAGNPVPDGTQVGVSAAGWNPGVVQFQLPFVHHHERADRSSILLARRVSRVGITDGGCQCDSGHPNRRLYQQHRHRYSLSATAGAGKREH